MPHNPPPRFIGLLVCRDEADIIAETLHHALEWCEEIHVLDTGSTDPTWDIVQDLAASEPRLRPFGRHEVVFDLCLRGWLFEHVRNRFRPGDWLAMLDADEIYHTDPRRFIPTHVKPHEGRVFAQMYEFMFTTAELADWQRGHESLESRRTPVVERRRAFVMDPVPEPRFYRYRAGLRWGAGHTNPFNPGLPARLRIPVRHYRWRDPPQMQARCELRDATRRISKHGLHWDRTNWRDWVIPDTDPRLHRWDGRSGLPYRNDGNHLGGPLKRFAQTILYRSGLPALLDPFRPGLKNWKPRPWPHSPNPTP